MTITAEIDRETLLRRLVSDADDAHHIMPLLADFGWDYAGTPVVLTRQQLIRLLHQYINGKLSAAKLEFWANCIEGRDDIAFEIAAAPGIEALVFELANPALTQPLTMERAKAILAELERD